MLAGPRRRISPWYTAMTFHALGQFCVRECVSPLFVWCFVVQQLRLTPVNFDYFMKDFFWVQVWPALFLRCVGRTESKGVKPRWNVRTKWCGPVATLVDLLSTSSSASVLLLSETERFWFEKQMDPTLPLISLPMFLQQCKCLYRG